MNGEALQSRMTILNRPLLTPGNCAVCGAVDKKVLDFGLDLEWYGRVYICEDCGVQIGTAFGSVPKEDFATLRIEKRRLEQRMLEVEDALKKVLTDADSIINSGLAGVHRLLYADGISSDDPKTPERNNVEAESEFNSSVADSSKSSCSKRSTSVSANSSSDTGLDFI